MKLSTDDLLALHQTAISAATEAGRLIAERTHDPVDVMQKTAGDSQASQVLTALDLACESIILKWLKPACAQYDLALLTEETTDDRSRLEKDNFWCIDPLDGTLSFIESTAGYAVAIALVSKAGVPLVAVVYDPVTSKLYSSVQGQGVWLNGQPWSVTFSEPIQGKVLTLVCDRDFLQRSDYPQIEQALEVVCGSLGFTGIQMIDKRAGAVMNALWVIEHQPACYFKLPKPETGGGSLWDFAASAAILNELGAVASDFHGQALELNRAESTFMNHRGVLFASHRALADEIMTRMKHMIRRV